MKSTLGYALKINLIDGLIAMTKKNVGVSLKTDKGNIRFCIGSFYAKPIYGKPQAYISFGAKESIEVMSEAYECLIKLQNDLLLGKFDPNNISKYQYKKNLSTSGYINFHGLGLLELFDKYVEFHKVNLAITTEQMYRLKFRNSIAQLGDINILKGENQRKVAEHLREHRAKRTQIEVLSTLNRAMEWAKEEKLINNNVTNNFPLYIERARKLPDIVKEQVVELQGFPRNNSKIFWNQKERDLIIGAFYERRKKEPFYLQIDTIAYAVEFLFFTGLRHGELGALTWNKLNYTDDQLFLLINQNYSDKYKVLKGTKNGKVRNIALSNKAKEILRKLKEDYSQFGIPNDGNDPIFLNAKGNRINTSNINKTWRGEHYRYDKVEGSSIYLKYRGVVSQLIREGKLPTYIEPYSTRRTFISLQAQKGVDPRTVADYVGDRVETILEHYYGGRENFIPIE